MLNFTRAQRNGLIVLSVFIILSLLFPFGVKYFKKEYKTSFSDFEKAINDAQIQKKKEYTYLHVKEDSLFVFDPNFASREDFQKLHLSSVQIKQVLNYRKKNGKFYKSEDFKKIYAIDDSTYHRLEAYISIQITERKSKKNKYTKYKKEKILAKENRKVIVEINSANQEELQKIRGIGPSLSKRMIKYRDALGGFVNCIQVAEVYGIDEEKYKEISNQLKCDKQLIHKIKINFCTARELEKHPYFSRKQAKDIIKNRSFNGRISSLKDLASKLNYQNDFIRKISPYIDF